MCEEVKMRKAGGGLRTAAWFGCMYPVCRAAVLSLAASGPRA